MLVVVPAYIGWGQLYNEDHSPCCSAGHAQIAGIWGGSWCDIFKTVAHAIGFGFKSVPMCNDAMPANTRPIVYAAAALLCGHEIQTDDATRDEAVRLANKVREAGIEPATSTV